MIVPRALILGVSEKGMLKECKVILNFRERDEVLRVLLSAGVELWHELGAIVPC